MVVDSRFRQAFTVHCANGLYKICLHITNCAVAVTVAQKSFSFMSGRTVDWCRTSSRKPKKEDSTLWLSQRISLGTATVNATSETVC